MPRQSTPWRRGGPKGPWYAQLHGKQVWLAPAEATKTEATEALNQLRGEVKKEKRRPGGLTFREAASHFLTDRAAAVGRGELKAVTLEGYERFLVPAEKSLGKIPVSALKTHHVQSWLDSEGGWGATTRNNAITAVKAALNWAKRAGHVAENPIRDMAKPRANVTESDLTAAQAGAIRGAVRDRPFRDFLAVLWGTGARPSEVMAIEARHLDASGAEVVMESKTTRRTGDKRTLYLSAEAAAVLARLAELHPTGPLLRNRTGEPWNRHTIGNRFRRMRGRLKMGREATAKSFRHGFITDALEAGVPIATVAELAGHRGTKMIERTYSKLRERKGHLRDAARKVRPGEADAS